MALRDAQTRKRPGVPRAVSRCATRRVARTGGRGYGGVHRNLDSPLAPLLSVPNYVYQSTGTHSEGGVMTDSVRMETLRQKVTGDVILPGESRYDECRTVFNAMHDKRPAVIARCASTADVAAAVTFAREHGLVVAVRCGGHSVAGLSVCDGGILIDLAGLKTIDVDPDARTARAGGGVLWGEFDAATQQHGLHTPGGRVTTTGVGGFTTGGGYGWTSSKHGLTCDNLLSAEVVLADGRVVTASDREHADLFWGIRGGGGNFGIVTEFEFRLHAARTDCAGRSHALAHRPRCRRHARVARLHGRRSRRVLDGVRDPYRSARGVRA